MFCVFVSQETSHQCPKKLSSQEESTQEHCMVQKSGNSWRKVFPGGVRCQRPPKASHHAGRAGLQPGCVLGAKHHPQPLSAHFFALPASFRLSSCEGWAELSVWHSEEENTNDPTGKSLLCCLTSPGKPARGGGVTHKPSWHTQSSTFSVLKPAAPWGVMQEEPSPCRKRCPGGTAGPCWFWQDSDV